jgi:phospholipid/cholesterol/gamma-HCH transport system substrate-binding protein
MKSFSERNHLVIGAVGIGVVAAAIVLSVSYTKLPFFNEGRDYSAYFAEAGGLVSGDTVEASGVRVGKVSSVDLDGTKVLVKFRIDGIRLGDRSEAAVKLVGLLGSRAVELRSRGEGEQTGPIPLDRTTPPYELPDALSDLSTTVNGLNTDQLSDSLSVLSDTLSNTPPAVKEAVRGVARVSESLDKRDQELRNLLSSAHKATKVLAERSDEIVNLVANTNALLVQLNTQSRALDQIFNNLSALALQVKGFVSENRDTLKPALDKLNGVLALVDKHKTDVQAAIKNLNTYALGLGEAVGSGPFFKASIVNIAPGQFVQPFINAAFSDLGLDPNVLAPSERADPQVGQPGTPPLPVPYPRTGQGGEPRRTLPDAITGNPNDPMCGLPGVPLPGPGCYPYRQPPPAPPPGGPPPGPPALAPASQGQPPGPSQPDQGGGQ